MTSVPSGRPPGFTLVELLLALALGSFVVLAAGAGYVFATRGWVDHQQRLETQQNLREAVETLTRELRLAGACLLTDQLSSSPANARPLDGTHTGGAVPDTITVRMNLHCAKGTLTASYTGGATIALDTVQNFVPGMWAYVWDPGANPVSYGEKFLVVAVNAGANQLTVAPGTITQNYPTADNSQVFGMEELAYAIDQTGPVPVLTVTTLDEPTKPDVSGIEGLAISYVLNRVGGACAGTTGPPYNYCVVTLPATAAEWAIVRDVQLTIFARSAQVVPGSAGYYRLSETTEISPRNLQF